MEVKYPIKYVILTFLDNGTYVIGEENEYYGKRVAGHIVSPCFLVSEGVEYLSDGNTKNIYEVVLPYTYIGQQNIEYPRYNFRDICNNSRRVDFVYESLYDADIYCGELNLQLRGLVIKDLLENKKPYKKDTVSEQLTRFDAELANIKNYELELIRKTCNLIDGYVPKKKK